MIRAKFQEWMSKLSLKSSSKLTSGEMLILAFNSLFENVSSAHADFRYPISSEE